MQMQSGVGDFHENWFEMRMVGLQPDRRSYHSSFIYDNKLFIFGGLDIREGSLDTLYELPLAVMQETILDELDRPNNQALLSMHRWRKVETTGNLVHTPCPLAHHTNVVYKDNLYLFGGNNPRSLNAQEEGTTELHCEKLFYLSLRTFSWSIVRTRGDHVILRDEHTSVYDPETA